MKTWGMILIIAALAQLGLVYLAAIDKIKPSKSTQILYYLLVAMSLFTSAIREFLR